MIEIAVAKPEDREDVFLIAAERLANDGIRLSPALIEKDFWVCWTLQRLFSLPNIASNLLFKGGTTLSKAFNVISRFSEDIDISVDREFVFPGKQDAVDDAPSKTQRRARVEELKAAFTDKITNTIYPALESNIRAHLPEGSWTLIQDDKEPGTLLFAYPRAVDSASDYNLPVVRIEMGGRNDTWPSEQRRVLTYAAPPGNPKFDLVDVPVLGIERTFWEKATILHNEYHRPQEKHRAHRLSRHYYDLFQLATHEVYGPQCLSNVDVLNRVVTHKSYYYPDNWSCYEEASTGKIHLVPPDYALNGLSEDYDKMRPMFFVDPPAFDEILTKLKQLEEEINVNLS